MSGREIVAKFPLRGFKRICTFHAIKTHSLKKIYLTPVSFLFILCSFAYAQTTHTIDALDYGNPGVAAQYNEIGYSIDGSIVEYSGCSGTPSIHVAIIDSLTCAPFTNCNNNFGQANIFVDPNGDCISDNNTVYTCRARPESYFIYRSNDAAQMESMANLLNSTGNGNYILVYTFLPSAFRVIDSAFVNSMQRLGSTLVITLPDSFPFIFFCKKGDTASVIETMGTHWEDTVSIHTTFECAPNLIDEIDDIHYLSVFPNPVSVEFTIEFGNQQYPVRISIYDVLGKLVFEKSIEENSRTINVKNFAEGFYFVKVTKEGYSGCSKVCVMH